MASRKQVAANRRNAKKSTGPRTLKGKAKSSGNALKHGILAEHTVGPGESRERFEAFRGRIVGSLQPVEGIEALLASRVVDCAWRLRRVLRFQHKTLDRTLDELVAEAVEQAERAEFTQRVDERVKKVMVDGSVPDGVYQQVENEVEAEVAEVSVEAEDLEEPPEPLDAFWACFDRVEVLSRYETTLERRMVKALHELQRLQAARQNGPAVAPMAFDFDVEVRGGGNGDG